MIRQSREHLAAAGEDYFAHFHFAPTVGLMAVAAGLACLIHSVVQAHRKPKNRHSDAIVRAP